MVAYLRTKHETFMYSEYLGDTGIQEEPLAPANDSEHHEELVIAVATRSNASLTEAEPSNEYIASEEVEEDIEEDLDERDFDINIASVYLREMNRVPLLTRKREIAVAKEIQESEQRIRDLLCQCPIATEEIQRLQRKSRREKIDTRSSENVVPRIIQRLLKMAQTPGEDADRLMHLVEAFRKAEADLKSAKAQMIQANLRLVVSIAKIYLNRGLSFLDLIQEGNMGLMKAVTRYDYRKGFKFSTYASWWIRQAITRALADKSRTIRIPNHLLETRSKMVKAFHELIKDLGRDPEPEEIATKARIPLSSVQKVTSLIQEPISLETPMGDDGSKLEDLVGNEEGLSSNDQLIENLDLAKKTHNLLSLLSPREEQILRLRFGIGLPSGYTLEEIGKRFGISRERVRQIEERAIKKLKYPTTLQTHEVRNE